MRQHFPHISRLTQKDRAQLFDGLKRYRALLIAVSGGVDSVALLHLLTEWAEETGDAPQIQAATIDHGLRAESADEAEWVAALCATLNVKHTVRRWTGEPPKTGVQAAARQARYALLTEVCAESRMPAPTAIVTAHTQNDQAETFLMRLARGSGLDGLSAMAPVRPLQNGEDKIDLVRPLLNVSRARLQNELSARGQGWCEDPSNVADKYERVRVREAITQLEALGITSDKIAVSAHRLQRAGDCISQTVSAFFAEHVDLHDGLCGVVSEHAFLSAPQEVKIRVLQRLLEVFGGQGALPQLQKIERLITALGNEARCAATLGGCSVQRRDSRLWVFREVGRAGLPRMTLPVGGVRIWDRRFRVARRQDKGGTIDSAVVEVSALDRDAVRQVQPHLSEKYADLPRDALMTVPAFWHQGALVAVPSLQLDVDGLSSAAGLTSRSGTGHGDCTTEFQASFIGLPPCQFETRRVRG